MNTNQDTTLTNQDVMLDLYKIHAYIPNDATGNPLTPFGNFCEGYEAATQASEIEINSLKERVAELQSHLSSQSLEIANYDVTLESYAHKVAGLQADNNQLREALELARKEYEGLPRSLGYEFTHLPIIYKALSSTSTQSLAEHDNEVIERCAQLSDACAYMSPNFNALSEEIRALKVTP